MILRPRENPWRIIPLSIVFVVCLAALIYQTIKAGELNVLLDSFIETTILVVFVLAASWITQHFREHKESADDTQSTTKDVE